ncbi:hypothetical protein B0T17DRAFT_645165 [Bombardia bombarda]|uniref:Uncharacterized protein n=1 Tax=Bombardia bombarda TaxID=252184 RepID=A0AA39WI72_9PEZI|nr:hypothetical protein B0T17DRAFT_645165 [Bombardia bombarda]
MIDAGVVAVGRSVGEGTYVHSSRVVVWILGKRDLHRVPSPKPVNHYVKMRVYDCLRKVAFWLIPFPVCTRTRMRRILLFYSGTPARHGRTKYAHIISELCLSVSRCSQWTAKEGRYCSAFTAYAALRPIEEALPPGAGLSWLLPLTPSEAIYHGSRSGGTSSRTVADGPYVVGGGGRVVDTQPRLGCLAASFALAWSSQASKMLRQPPLGLGRQGEGALDAWLSLAGPPPTTTKRAIVLIRPSYIGLCMCSGLSRTCCPPISACRKPRFCAPKQP